MDDARNEPARREKQSLTTAIEVLPAILCQAIGKGNVSRIRLRTSQAACILHGVEKRAGCPAGAAIGIDDRIRSENRPIARFGMAIGQEQSAHHVVVFGIEGAGEPQSQFRNARFHRSNE